MIVQMLLHIVVGFIYYTDIDSLYVNGISSMDHLPTETATRPKLLLNKKPNLFVTDYN